MTVFFALANGEQTRRLRAALPRSACLQSFETPAALLRHVADSSPPTGLMLANLTGDRVEEQLLVELERALPGCPRTLWSQDDDLPRATLVLNHGGLERLLGSGAQDAEITEAFRALENCATHRSLEQAEYQRTDFARQVLGETVARLEQHLDVSQGEALVVESLMRTLRSVDDLVEVTKVAATILSAQLPGRGVHIALNGGWAGDAIESSAGSQLGEVEESLVLRGYEREFGVLEIMTGAAGAGELSATERRLLQASEAPLSLVIQGLVHRQERNDAQLATVHGLARLAEDRDDTTGRHLERVSVFSRMLGEFLRASGIERATLTDGFLQDLELSAPLHDIGKVAVPDAILKKPGKLTADEWEIMRSHAELGAQALETILNSSGEQSYLRMGHAIAWCHHEHWDGNGYPRGLREEEIPLEARIMALADVYDALTTVRPYKQAWAHERTCEYISGLSGQQFDPDIVRIFLAHAGEFDLKRAQLADSPPVAVAA